MSLLIRLIQTRISSRWTDEVRAEIGCKALSALLLIWSCHPYRAVCDSLFGRLLAWEGGIWSYALKQAVQSGSLLGACSAVAFAYGENRKVVSARIKGFALAVIGVLLVGGTGRTADEVMSSLYSLPSSSGLDQVMLTCAGFVSLVLAAMALGALGAAGFARSDNRA